MQAECVFCKILEGKLPATRLYEDEEFICIRDTQPQAPIHLLLISKRHISSILEVKKSEIDVDEKLFLGHLTQATLQVVEKMKMLEKGFKILINTGKGAGQSVFHLHIHLMGETP